MYQTFVLEDFIKQNQIGYGSYAKVYKVLEKKSNVIYAAKILNDEIEDKSGQLYSDIAREVSILSKLCHPSILKLIFFSPRNFKNEPRPVIITEYASNGTLHHFIEMDRLKQPLYGWNDTRKLIIIYGISSAMSYLHQHNIIHRDLKPANILIDEFFLPKIADFGISITAIKDNDDILLQSFSNKIKGTPIYMSPEIWENDEYGKPSDVYAFGLIMYEIYTSETLFENCNIYNILNMIRSGYHPPFIKQIPVVYKNLIERCWQFSSNKRPTFEQIVNELKNNRQFITKTVDEEEFFRYVKYIDEYKIAFDRSNLINLQRLFNIVKPKKGLENIMNYDFQFKYFPYTEFIKLKEGISINFVKEAEDDPNKQFIVGKYLVEGINDFPFNVQLGIEYLRESYKNGNIEATIYYIRMLINGKLIPKNHQKAIKLLDSYLIQDKSTYFLLYGKLFKDENRFEEAMKCFEDSIKEGNGESMYEYGKMYIKGQGIPKNNEKGIQYYKMAIDKEFSPAMYKYGQYLINQKDENNILLGHEYIHRAADQGNAKANYLYGEILYNKNEI